MLFASSLAGCGPLSNNQSSQSQKSAPLEQTSSEASTDKNPQDSAKNVQASIAIPPRYDSRPPKPGQSPSQTMPNGLPALQTKGVNVDTLFAQDITDSNTRFARIENAVLDLRREFESFKPAITRLVAVESDIQDLIKQLDILLRTEQSSPPPMATSPPPTPVSAPTPPPPKLQAQDTIDAPHKEPAAPPKAVNGSTVVQSLRIGEHGDKTRLVLDVNRQTAYSTDLDNQENLLIIETPDAGWSGDQQQSFSKSQLLRSYSVKAMNDGKGSRVIISLKRGTKILKEQALPPGKNPNHRIFIDLQK